MEKLVTKFKDNEYNKAIQLLLEEREEDISRVIELEQEVRKLKRGNKKLKKRLINKINSKSWKVTAPLRRIVQWKDNKLKK